MKTIKFIRQNEINDIYQCTKCNNYITVPKNCDVPDCRICFEKEIKELKQKQFQND